MSASIRSVTAPLDCDTKDAKKPAATVSKFHNTIKQSGKKKGTKKFLKIPFQKKWPTISEAVNTYIVKHLTETLSKKGISREVRGGKKVKQRKEKALMQAGEQTNDKTEEVKPIGQYIIFGINAVTRALERGDVSLVVADRSPSPLILTRHLIDLAMHHKIPAVGIWNTAEICQTVGIKTMTALAFKPKDTIDDQCIKQLIDNITAKSPKIVSPIDVPELDLTTDDGINASNALDIQNKNDNQENLNQDQEKTMPKKRKLVDLAQQKHTKNFRLPADDIDFTSLYVYKKDLSKPIDSTFNADFLAFGKDSESENDDEIPNVAVRYTKVSVGDVKYNPNRTRKK